jgi:large repetitive protein
MKKKIIGIFVCMLMMVAVVLPTAGTETNIVSFCVIPNDPDFIMQWHLNNTGQTFGTPDADIDANEAWDIETGNADIVIAIIDTGVDYTHPDLAANIWNNVDEIPNNGIDDDHNGYIDDIRGWNFYDNNSDPKDVFGHGTMCAGITAAVGNNGVGIAGVTWNCKIMPVRFEARDDEGGDTWPKFIKGIKYAVENGANIISISTGNYDIQDVIGDAINDAYDKGVFVCAAAGNDNANKKLYPAAFDNVIAVGGTDHNDKRAYFSTYGEWIDIAAPAINIYSTMPTYDVPMNHDPYGYTQTYSNGAGTSFSAPQVAGVAALLLSIDPTLTPAELKTFLCGNVDPYVSTGYIGTGRLNAQKAVAAVLQSQLPPNTPTITGEINGAVQTSYDYTIQTTDPEQHDVRYTIDWGDSTTTTTGLNESGKQIVVPHIWSTKGTYDIKVKAIDKFGAESEWATLTVTMPYNYNKPMPQFLELLFERFPNAFPVLRHLMRY